MHSVGLLTLNSAYVKSNGEWIARCILMGFFIAPIEALPEISVTDIVRGNHICKNLILWSFTHID